MITTQMRKRNALVFAIVASEMQEPGWPDRILNHRYTGTVFLEFKGVHTRLNAKQRLIIKGLCERDCAAYVVRQPNRIEDYNGLHLASFDGTGWGLIKTLQELRFGPEANDDAAT